MCDNESVPDDVTPDLSVAVCTHNRADLMRDVVQDLIRQAPPADRFEVLIVDNASTDQTPEVGRRLAEQHENVRYVREDEVGLSHARNRAWREARGEYVGYVDDDCRVPRQWLERAQRVAQARRPAVFGGPYYACYNRPKPQWYKDEYGSRSLGAQPRSVTDLPGGNLFVRRSLLAQMGGFSADLGMSGNHISYGEESEWLVRLHRRHPEQLIWYEPGLYLYHLVRPQKMTLSWAIRHHIARGRDKWRLFSGSRPVRNSTAGIRAEMMRVVYRTARDCLNAFTKRDRVRFPHYRNYLYECSLPRLARLGELVEKLRRKRCDLMKGK